MTIESAIIILFVIDIGLMFIGRKLIPKVAKGLDEAMKELRNNNYNKEAIWILNWDCREKSPPEKELTGELID